MTETMTTPVTDDIVNLRQNDTGDKAIDISGPARTKLTLFQTCSILVSSIGSSGMFMAISTMMHSTGSIGVLLMVVLGSGLLNFSLAICFSEVAALLPKAGGPYFFLKQVYGNIWAFLFIWGFVFMIITPVWAVMALTSSIYIVQLFFPNCNPPDLATKLLAVVILVLVVLVNCLYMKYVTKIQVFLTSTKIIASGVVIVMALVALAQGGGEPYKRIFEGTSHSPGDYAVSILSGMFLFGGWQLITFLLEEMESPEKNLSKSLSISFTLSITLCELVVSAYFVVLTPNEVRSNAAVAVLFTDRVFRPLSPVMSLLVTATSLGGLNGAVLAQSRLVSATAKQGHMPRLLALYSVTYNMPWAATAALCAISILMLVFADLGKMIIMTSFYATVMGLAVLLCLIALRIRQPTAHRPVKVWVFTIVVQMLISVATLVMSIIQRPQEIGALALFVLAGIPVYVVFIQGQAYLKPINMLADKLTVLFQKVLLLKEN